MLPPDAARIAAANVSGQPRGRRWSGRLALRGRRLDVGVVRWAIAFSTNAPVTLVKLTSPACVMTRRSSGGAGLLNDVVSAERIGGIDA
jgi:hypothetical protein